MDMRGLLDPVMLVDVFEAIGLSEECKRIKAREQMWNALGELAFEQYKQRVRAAQMKEALDQASK